MAELQDKIGSGLAKIQGGLDAGKKKLESSKEVFRLKKEVGEAGQAKGMLYLKMGQQAYFLLRQGKIGDELLKNLGREIMVLDTKTWKLNEELSQYAPAEEIFCPKCGQKVDEGGSFCSSCGNPVELQSQESEAGQPCLNCHVAIPSEARFCPCCGVAVGGGKSVL